MPALFSYPKEITLVMGPTTKFVKDDIKNTIIETGIIKKVTVLGSLPFTKYEIQISTEVTTKIPKP